MNTTRCPGTKDTDADGENLMSMCETSIPFQITTKSEEYAHTSTSGVSIFLVIVAAIGALGALFWSFRRCRGVNEKVDSLTRQLEKVRNRQYRNQPRKIWCWIWLSNLNDNMLIISEHQAPRRKTFMIILSIVGVTLPLLMQVCFSELK